MQLDITLPLSVKPPAAPQRKIVDSNGMYAICPNCKLALQWCRGHTPAVNEASGDDGAGRLLAQRAADCKASK